MHDSIKRRQFLRQVGAGMIGGAVVRAAESGATTQPSVGTIKDLPTRKLGRIGIRVPPLSFGSAAMGHAFFTKEPFEEVAFAAIEAGVRYIDTAPIYDVAEERLAPVLAKHRKDVFLVTKTMKHNRDDCLRDIETSLKRMKTDHVDLVHIHNLGDYSYTEVTGKGGVLEALREAKKRGWLKYIGCSGHVRPHRFVPIIETGEIDLIMVAMNFVDRNTYNFEEKVLPAARKQDCAIVCMKVLGGAKGEHFSGYRKRAPGLLSEADVHQMAFDYAFSIPDVATMVVGLKSLDEIRLAIKAIRNRKPFEGPYRETVLAKGAEIAKEWGEHFGPVA